MFAIMTGFLGLIGGQVFGVINPMHGHLGILD